MLDNGAGQGAGPFAGPSFGWDLGWDPLVGLSDTFNFSHSVVIEARKGNIIEWAGMDVVVGVESLAPIAALSQIIQGLYYYII
jgi:hypothetical protein